MAVFNPPVGQFPLTGVAGLPNVTVAYPGEHWSDRIAQAAIVPGGAVVPVNISGKLGMRPAVAADNGNPRMAIALRTIDIPDGASDSFYTHALGPNEIKNLEIAPSQYVHAYYSGVFHLTLIEPRAWVPGELVSWDDGADRPAGKGGTGATPATGSWTAETDPALGFFEVQEYRPLSSDGHEGILTVRSLRGQH